MVLQRIPIYINDFGDGTQDLPVLSGNGTVSETGGALVVSATAGTNVDWWTWGRNGKLPYVGVSISDDYTKIYYEFTIRSWTTTNTSISALVVALFQSDTVLWFLYSQDGATFNVYKNWSTGSLGSIVTTLPRKFRFVWDRSTKTSNSTVSLQCLTTVSPPTWTTVMAAQTVSMTPIGLGFGIKNWSSLPACTVQYEDTEIYAESFQELTVNPSGVEDSLVFPSAGPSVGGGGGGGLGIAGTGPAREGWQYGESTFVGFEDNGRLVPAGGSPDPMSGIPDGVLVPEPNGLEDQASLPSAGGTPDHVTGIPEGFLLSDPTGGLEDTSYVEAMVPAYVQNKNDADGRSFLGDMVVYDVQPYDTTSEPWASTTPGSGFYGAARDGKFYYDGYECGPTLNGTTFGTLADGFNRKTWMIDVEPSAINSAVTNPTLTMPADDTIRFAGTAMVTGNVKAVTSSQRWCLVGDFDISVSFANYTGSGGSDGGLMFMAHLDRSPTNSSIPTCFYVRRWGNTVSGRIDSNVHINGGTGNYVFVTSSATSGKFRLVRSGNTVSTYYDVGAGWVLLRSGITNAALGQPMWITFYMDGYTSKTSTGDFSVFTIGSGTPSNLVGWAREAAGTYRGSRSSFPEKTIVSASRYAVDLIDYANNKLWMRFVAASNNAMHNASIACRHVRMRNGMLMIPYNTGGDICVDFTTDDIRVHSALVEAWTGALLRSFDGTYWAQVGISGRDVSPAGIIASRNLAGGYSGDNNNWQIPSTTVYDTDLFEASGYLYKVHATAVGMGGHKWRRWYNDGTTPENWWSPGVGKSAETTAMLWCEIAANGDLFYLDSTMIYSANFATWDAKVGGSLQTWTADYSNPLPGTRDTAMSPQGRAAIVGSAVFVPADEGVYKSAWPGPFVLQYGWSESGALYPILGWNPRQVYSIRAVRDNLGTPLLAIGTHFVHNAQNWSQVILVNPATNSVYGISPALRGRTLQALGG